MQIITLDGLVELLAVCIRGAEPGSICSCAAPMSLSNHLKSTGAIGVPSNGNPQHNRIVLVKMPKMNVGKKEKKAEKRKKLKQHVAQTGELELDTEPKKKKQSVQVRPSSFDWLIQ
ncbi:hypothetical protein Q9233_004943 [Columba guinea]|nr:hypothetical protein Q9233_004943 [Columba guinea]